MIFELRIYFVTFGLHRDHFLAWELNFNFDLTEAMQKTTSTAIF